MLLFNRLQKGEVPYCLYFLCVGTLLNNQVCTDFDNYFAN